MARSPQLLILVAIVFALGGCGHESAHDGIRDDLGYRVDVPDPVDRLVSLAPNLTEIIFAAGAGDLLVGVTTADDYPPETEHLTRISALPVDFERLVALRPDLVVATDQVNSPRDIRTFDGLGIPVYFFSFATIDDVFEAIRTIGRITHRYPVADSAASELEQRYAAVNNQDIEDRPRVLFLVSDEILYSFGQGSYVHDMIEAAGGASITRDIRSAAPVLSEEFVLTSSPDLIIGTFGPTFSIEALVNRRPAWRSIPAIREGNVYSIDSDFIHRPGPRVIDGIEQIARILSRFRGEQA